jgi:hypothetical protein
MKVSCVHFSAHLHPCLVEFVTAKSLASSIFRLVIQKSAINGRLLNLLDEVTDKRDENAVVPNIVYIWGFLKGLIIC